MSIVINIEKKNTFRNLFMQNFGYFFFLAFFQFSGNSAYWEYQCMNPLQTPLTKLLYLRWKPIYQIPKSKWQYHNHWRNDSLFLINYKYWYTIYNTAPSHIDICKIRGWGGEKNMYVMKMKKRNFMLNASLRTTK